MPRYLAALTILLLLAMVITRLLLVKRQGIAAMKFGETNKTDFLIPPFALFYFYIIFAAAFDFPTLSDRQMFHYGPVEWIGVAFCVAGLSLLLSSLISFGSSFRVGIDTSRPDKLITTGVFKYSRNPIYAAFAFVLVGEFLVFLNWILLVYVVAGFWLLHRQVLREEEYLTSHYGEEYAQYRRRVRRYL
ncbi:MAG TPA: isoprenylcysteine carboxylmethyltransferase family protein [Terriglobales bacterium]|nr:isoprenylcysteine carboxylmethyltransferase family protein [Terriglobales bacterium]